MGIIFERKIFSQKGEGRLIEPASKYLLALALINASASEYLYKKSLNRPWNAYLNIVYGKLINLISMTDLISIISIISIISRRGYV